MLTRRTTSAPFVSTTIVLAAGPSLRLAAQAGGVALFLWTAFESEMMRRLIAEVAPSAGQALLVAALVVTIAAALRRRLSADASAQQRSIGPPGRLAAIASLVAPVLAVVAFLLPAFHSWTTVQPIWPGGGALVLGVLPWSDAGDYYNGAEGLLIEGSLDAWNQRRPLNAALLATRLALLNHDLRLALLLQAILLGLSSYVLAKTVARLLGGIAGLATFALLYAFGHRFAHLTLSEALGLTLGALALGLLLAGQATGRRRDVALGLGCLTLALSARAGAFLVLPLLVLWCGFSFRRGRRFDGATALLASAAIIGAFVVNGLVLWLYGDGLSLGQGNFSFVLYGLATGNTGWQQVYRDYPQLAATADARTLNGEIYRLAFEKIASDPILLARGLASRVGLFLTTFPRELIAFLPLTSDRYVDGLVYLLVSFTAVQRVRAPVSRKVLCLFGFFGVGLLLSGAVVYGDTDLRVFAATFPFFALPVAVAASTWQPRPDPDQRTAASLRPVANLAAILACTLTVAAVVGPGVAHRLATARLTAAPICPGGDDGLTIYVRPGSAHVEILSPADPRPTFLPTIRDEDFARTNPGFGSTPLGRLDGPTTILAAHDLRAGQVPQRYVFVIGDPAVLRAHGDTTYLCGVFEQQGWFKLFRATSLAPAPQPSGDD